VGYGERTNDEMSKSWVNFYYMSEEEYQAEVSARKTRMNTSKANASKVAGLR
jgi:PHD/YefM family antitoxin component YafN of YafNO toxin-antitoxin module